ncbi:hypothetical protein KAJ27_01370 [bacterium]|nr:hypothetical protein [bacterium]
MELSGYRNAHVADPTKNVYAQSLFCRAGIPLLCPEVKYPTKPGDVWSSCDDSPRADFDDDGLIDHPHAFCNVTTDCVAYNETSSQLECYSVGSLVDVDDYSGSGQKEKCSEYSAWCPIDFHYDLTRNQCEFNQDACYDDDVASTICIFRETDSIFSEFQYWNWFEDPICNNYDLDAKKQACCFTTEIHGEIYQYYQEILIFDGQGKNCTSDEFYDDICNN